MSDIPNFGTEEYYLFWEAKLGYASLMPKEVALLLTAAKRHDALLERTYLHQFEIMTGVCSKCGYTQGEMELRPLNEEPPLCDGGKNVETAEQFRQDNLDILDDGEKSA